MKYDFDYTPETLLDEIFSQLFTDDRAGTINFLKGRSGVIEPEVKAYFKVSVIEPKLPTIQPPPKNQSDNTNIPDFFMCYCDLIHPQIVGNQLSRLLLMAPIKSYTQQAMVEFNNIQYCNVEKTRITEINFLITDRFTEQINFDASIFMTRILLHFKRSI